MERGTVSAAACRAKCLDWRAAARIVAYRRVGWAIDYLPQKKHPDMDEIFPDLLQEGREILIPYLVNIFRACLATGHVSAMWRQLKALIIRVPKHGRTSYYGPRDFRTISLTVWRGSWIDF